MTLPDDRPLRFRAFVRAAMGLHELDHPTFAALPRVWRAVFYPSFHDAVAITLSDLDVGGWVDVRAADRTVLDAAMVSVGWAQPAGFAAPSPPRVWEATVKEAVLESVTAAMPRLPLHSVPMAGRDGIWIDYFARVDGQPSAFSAWCPTVARAPLHHAYAVTLCQVAVQTVADPSAHAAVNALAQYLRA